MAATRWARNAAQPTPVASTYAAARPNARPSHGLGEDQLAVEAGHALGHAAQYAVGPAADQPGAHRTTPIMWSRVTSGHEGVFAEVVGARRAQRQHHCSAPRRSSPTPARRRRRARRSRTRPSPPAARGRPAPGRRSSCTRRAAGPAPATGSTSTVCTRPGCAPWACSRARTRCSPSAPPKPSRRSPGCRRRAAALCSIGRVGPRPGDDAGAVEGTDIAAGRPDYRVDDVGGDEPGARRAAIRERPPAARSATVRTRRVPGIGHVRYRSHRSMNREPGSASSPHRSRMASAHGVGRLGVALPGGGGHPPGTCNDLAGDAPYVACGSDGAPSGPCGRP